MNNKTLKLVLGILLALALAVGLYFGVKALNNSNHSSALDTTGSPETTAAQTTGEAEGTQPSTEAPELSPEAAAVKAKDVYTLEDLIAKDPRLSQTVASCGDYSIDNRQAQIHYCMQFFNFMNQYGAYAAYFGLDETQPLSGQASMMVEGLSWEQYFLMAGMDQFHQFAAAASKATAEGYSLPQEESERLESALSGMAEDAKQYGYDSVDEYLQASFGPCVTQADYESYLRLYFLAMSYENAKYLELAAAGDWSDEDLEEYLTEHAQELGEGAPYPGNVLNVPSVNVRHILIGFSDTNEDGTTSDEEKAAAQAKAQELLAGYKTNPSEDYFAQLANENSEDPGSNNNGGLYEEVYPGQMVQAFNDWCFDAARQPGDTDIVETSYGYHVMYYVGQTEVYHWKDVAKSGFAGNLMNTWIQEIMDLYPVEIQYSDVVLAPIPVEEAAEQPVEQPTEQPAEQTTEAKP